MAHEHSGSGDISRSLALMWEFDLGHKSRGPKPKLSLDAIVDAAVDVADAEGLDAVSMRRIGQELGVGTMSLYRYVPGKEELLDLMLERVNAPERGRARSATTGARRWRRWAAACGRSTPPTRGCRWSTRPARCSARTPCAAWTSPSPRSSGTGLTGKEQVAVISAIESFVVSAARNHNGAALAEQATGVSHEEFWAAQEPVLSKAMQSGDYPYVAALDMDAFEMGGEEFMEFGLTLLLDGVAVLVEGRAAHG